MPNTTQLAALNAASIDARGSITVENGFHKNTLEALARAGLLERRGTAKRQGRWLMTYSLTLAGAETLAAR